MPVQGWHSSGFPLVTIVDFSLLIIVWTLQLIIYPSIRYIDSGNTYEWWKLNVRRFSFFFYPLILLQLFYSTWSPFMAWYSGLSEIVVADKMHGLDYDRGIFIAQLKAVLVIFVLFISIVFIRPIHQKIKNNLFSESDIARLLKINWIRTFTISLIFSLYFLYRIISPYL